MKFKSILIILGVSILGAMSTQGQETAITELRDGCGSGCLPMGNGIYRMTWPVTYAGCRSAEWWEEADGCFDDGNVRAICGRTYLHIGTPCSQLNISQTVGPICTNAVANANNTPCP